MTSYSSRKVFRWNVLSFSLIMFSSFALIFFQVYNLFEEVPTGDVSACDDSSMSSMYSLAKYESLEFFDDIDSKTWKLHQDRARLEAIYLEPENPNKGTQEGAVWLLSNVDPIFTCPNLRRLGGRGDGPKWTCDPHRLLEKDDCLIYSIGSFGIYLFEDGMVSFSKQYSDAKVEIDESWVPNCEIHVFDPNPSYARDNDGAKNNIHYHPWGLKSSSSVFDRGSFPESYEFLTFSEIRQRLGHEDRRIDIFKIDCESCEFVTFRDWLDPSIDIRQILVETHYLPEMASQFFDRFLDLGFVLFSKEANTHPHALPSGVFFEWGWLRLHPNFLNRSTSLI